MEIERFLKKLASSDPTPGGGSAAALSGSIAAALLAMVAKLSAADRPKAMKVAEEAEQLAKTCRNFAKEDEKAFEAVMAAYKLPKQTLAQKSARTAKIEEALKKATDVPLHSAKAALRILELADNFLDEAKRNVLSDLGVAALLARAASEGAILNVLINIASLKDKQFRNNMIRQAEAVVQEGQNRQHRIIQEIHRVLHEDLKQP